MSSVATITWNGGSGKEYAFEVYLLDSTLPSISAVYVVTRRFKNDSGGHNHSKVYIGETEDIQDRFSNHHKQDCFDSNDANAVCTHEVSGEASRKAIENDLLDNFNPPCND